MSRPGRNDPCPCGSGKKYKQCCLSREQASPRPDALQAPAMMQQATALYRAGRFNEAEAIFRRVTEIAPQHADACFSLGQVCNQQGRLAEAIHWLRMALERNPRHARAYNTLGMALDGQGESVEAITCYRKALKIDPDAFEPLYNLGSALQEHGSLDEAVACLEKAARIQPSHGLTHMALGQALLKHGDIERARVELEQAVTLSPGVDLVQDIYLFALNYTPLAPEAICKAHCAYGARFEGPFKSSWRRHHNVRDPDRRLRVGYVSPDFRQHSVAAFIEPVLAHHDKTRIEAFGYYNGIVRDTVTERLATLVDHWLPCAGLTDAQLAERIVDDGIDVLVDLAGHTTGNRLLTFARRPAPVQVTYLGYPATTGLSAIDYRIVTAVTDPPGAEAWHSERLWRLPRSLWCYRPDSALPPVEPQTPARRHGHVRFVSTNNIAKLSDAAVAAWARILDAVPGSQLVISNIAEGTARRLIHRRFGARGIEAARIELHGKLPADQFHALLNDVDIALDPWPYNGTTTTCDSLWMGLPLVTMIGTSSAGRSGFALLASIGLTELAAPDEAEYVRIATALAQDLPRLDHLRTSMRERMERSALRDESGMTRDLEKAYRAMWHEWCAGTR